MGADFKEEFLKLQRKVRKIQNSDRVVQIRCFQHQIDFFRVLPFREIFVSVTAKKCMYGLLLLATIIIRNGDFKATEGLFHNRNIFGREGNSSVDTIFQGTS